MFREATAATVRVRYQSEHADGMFRIFLFVARRRRNLLSITVCMFKLNLFRMYLLINSRIPRC